MKEMSQLPLGKMVQSSSFIVRICMEKGQIVTFILQPSVVASHFVK